MNQHAEFFRDYLIRTREVRSAIGIRIVRGKNCCSMAERYVGCYRLEDVPDYPFGPCEYSEQGWPCGCTWETIFEDEVVGINWSVPERRHPDAGGYKPRDRAPSSSDD